MALGVEEGGGQPEVFAAVSAHFDFGVDEAQGKGPGELEELAFAQEGRADRAVEAGFPVAGADALLGAREGSAVVFHPADGVGLPGADDGEEHEGVEGAVGDGDVVARDQLGSPQEEPQVVCRPLGQFQLFEGPGGQIQGGEGGQDGEPAPLRLSGGGEFP